MNRVLIFLKSMFIPATPHRVIGLGSVIVLTASKKSSIHFNFRLANGKIVKLTIICSLWLLLRGKIVENRIIDLAQRSYFYFNCHHTRCNKPSIKKKYYNPDIFWQFGKFISYAQPEIAWYNTIMCVVILGCTYVTTQVHNNAVLSNLHMQRFLRILPW